MTFRPLTNSDYSTNQTFHQFYDLITNLTFTKFWVDSMEHLQRVWHVSRERLPFRTPGFVPLWGTCLCSNCWDQIPRICHVFTRLFTLNTPWYFLNFAFDIFHKRYTRCQRINYVELTREVDKVWMVSNADIVIGNGFIWNKSRLVTSL